MLWQTLSEFEYQKKILSYMTHVISQHSVLEEPLLIINAATLEYLLSLTDKFGYTFR